MIVEGNIVSDKKVVVCFRKAFQRAKKLYKKTEGHAPPQIWGIGFVEGYFSALGMGTNDK